MANPQKENGHTQIANEILENIVRIPLSGTQFRLIMIVWRYTYGFNRKYHGISETFLAKSLGTSRSAISRELKVLLELNIITVHKAPTFKESAIIGFNKDYDSWVQVSKQITRIAHDTTTGIGSDTSTGIGSDTQERKYKDILKKTIKTDDKSSADVFFDSVWKLYPRHINDRKSAVKKGRKQNLEKLGMEVVSKAISDYLEKQKPEFRHAGNNFFNEIIDNFIQPAADAIEQPEQARIEGSNY